MAELKRLSGLTQEWDWSGCAVVAREWKYLDPVRSLCELEGIPVQMANEEISSIWQLRETQALVNWLRERDSRLVASGALNDWLDKQPETPWTELLQEAIAEYALETGGAETGVIQFIEWLAEWGREVRRRQRGLLLMTAHRAKGLEFDHVAIAARSFDDVLPLLPRLAGASATEPRRVESPGVEVCFVGDVELIRPLARDSGVARFVERRGPGLHHTA